MLIAEHFRIGRRFDHMPLIPHFPYEPLNLAAPIPFEL